MKGFRFAGMWIFLVLAGSAVIGLGQRQGSSSGGSLPTQTIPSRTTNYPPVGGVGMGPVGAGDPMSAPDVLSGRIAEQQARTRNAERQKRLESDTDKLVGLVTDFKQQVQGEKPLSPDDVSKRAEEIEKLARSVKDRMKG